MLSVAAPAQFPVDEGAEIAIAGRSNAGKSSAINAITQRRSLARTSKTPGRTRLLNFFELSPQRRLIDLPGYGYAEGPPADRDAWARLIAALATRESMRGLLLVVDCRRGLLEADEQLLGWAQGEDLPVHVLFAKSDQLKRAALQTGLAEAGRKLADRGTVQAFSAHDGVGVEEARKQIDLWLA